MKTWINRLSLVGIACALLTLFALHNSAGEERGIEPPVPAVVDKPTPLALESFGHFPKNEKNKENEWQTVVFDTQGGDLETLTRRQQRDQMLDWTMLALLSDSDLDAAALTEVLHDLPPRRSGYMAEIADFDYGPTRSRYLGEGRVLALIPAEASPEERRDHLAHIADANRKDLGEKPSAILVFEYDLHAADGHARVRRGEEIPGAELFSAAYGYREHAVVGASDFTRFMREVDDLTFARLETGALRFGGRKLQAPYRGIGMEEVAAIWQAEAKIQPTLPEIDEFEKRWSEVTYRTEAEKMQLVQTYERAWALFKERISRQQGSSHFNLVRGSGFSLDPAPKYDELLKSYQEELEPELRPLANAATGEARDLEFSPDGGFGKRTSLLSTETLDQIRGELANGRVETYLSLADELSNSSHPLRRLLGAFMEAVYEEHQFQAARYDGALQGTETGMVLFYTDLLAKLWALDFTCNAPDQYVDDFEPLTRVASSSVFEEERKAFSSTRLWFGPLDRGFQTLNEGTLLFARNSTRVYAASSNALRPGKETEPNADSAAFLGWWNDHYEEVARYEPQYQRLNEIMKWSLLIGWLHTQDAANRLAFLALQPVGHNHWFPDWVQSHPELRFREWPKISFFPRGYRGTSTETLPLLSSDRFRNCGTKVRDYHGGVSLADRNAFIGRRALTATDLGRSKYIRSASLDYMSVGGKGEIRGFKTLADAQHIFRELTPTRATLVSTPKATARLRTWDGQLRHTSFERRLERADGWLAIDTRASEASFGRVEVARTENGFQVGWQARDIDTGQSLARRLSVANDFRGALIADRGVDAAVDLGNGQFAVRLTESDSWLRLGVEAKPSVDLVEGWTARVSAPITGKHNVQLAWIKNEEAQGLVAKGRVLKPGKTINHGKAIVSLEDPRGPPAIAELREGNFLSTARRLASDGRAFKNGIDQYAERSLQQIDRALAEGRPDQALERLDDLAKIFGETPDIRLRRGLGLLDQHRLRDATTTLASDFKGPWRHGEGFFDEINRRLQQSQLTGARRENLRRLAEYADWKDVQRKQPGWKGDAKIVTDGERLWLHFDVPVGAPIRKLKPTEVSELAQAKPVLYIQDSSGLNNNEWHLSTEATLREISSGRLPADVFSLPRGDIAHFNPATTYVPAVTTKPLKRLGAQVDTSTSLRPQSFARWPGQNGGDCNEGEGDCDGQPGQVYLVVTRLAA